MLRDLQRYSESDCYKAQRFGYCGTVDYPAPDLERLWVLQRIQVQGYCVCAIPLIQSDGWDCCIVGQGYCGTQKFLVRAQDRQRERSGFQLLRLLQRLR